MIRIWFVIVFFLFAACAQTGFSPRPAATGDPLLDSYNAAVAAAPNNPEPRAARCLYLGELAERSRTKEEWQQLRRRALADCEHALNTATDGRRIANTLDLLRVLDWRTTWFQKKDACPENAQKAESAAYKAFITRQHSDAVVQYKAAVDACPNNASLWVQYGHTYMMMGDLPQAERYMLEGVKRDRWQRSGNLFLSDLYRSQGQLDLAYKHAALSVVSDPTYELGWEQLKELAKARGREWRRVVNRRAVVVIKEATPLISLPLGTVLEAPESGFWVGLALTEAYGSRPGSKPQVFMGVGDDIAATLRGLIQNGRTFPDQLKADRERVKMTLDFEREAIAKDPKKASLLTEVMQEAVDKGYLDEAIFLSLFEFRLLTDYVEYREKNAERLLDYIATILAPPQRL
jgi:tetratricopeptide (TPR) repeat protein